jgi:hypothetical protein
MQSDVPSPVSAPPPQSSAATRRRARRPLLSALLWVLSLLILFVAAMCTIGAWTDSIRGRARVMLEEGGAPAEAIGCVIGGNFFNGLLLIVGVVLLARRARIRGTLSCLAAAGLLLLGTAGLFWSGPERLSAGEAQRMRESLAGAMEGVAREGDVGEAPAGDLGAASDFVGLMREQMERAQAARRGYQLRVLELRLENVLLPSRLDSREEIADSRRRVRDAEETFERVLGELEEITRATSARLRGTAPPGEDPDLLVRNFEAAQRRMAAAELRHSRYEREALDSIRAILDLCEGELGTLQLQGDMLVFETGAAAVQYNLELLRLQEAVRRQGKIAELVASDQAESAEQLIAGGNGPLRPPPYAGPNGDVFAVDCSGIALNERSIGVPRTATELREAFGEPDRVEGMEDSEGYLWDGLGVAAEVGPREQVRWLTLTTNVLLEGEGAVEPERPFGGVIELFGVEVSDVDTPVSLNRRLEGEHFEMHDEEGRNWRLACDGFEIVLWVWSAGMTDGVTIAPVYEEPVVEVRPRF